MKKFFAHLLAVYLTLQPAVAFAIYDTPSALLEGISRDGAPHSFSGEMHGSVQIPTNDLGVYISVWTSGEMTGSNIRTSSMNMKITADFSIPQENITLRIKFAMRKVRDSIFVKLENIDSTLQDDISKLGISYLMKKWIEFPLSEEYMAMMEAISTEEASSDYLLGLNDILRLTHTKTKSGHSYSLRLAEDVLEKGIFEGLEIDKGSLQTNFHFKIDTSPTDQFLFHKIYVSAENATDKFVASGKSQKMNKAVVVVRPQESILAEELTGKYGSLLDSLPWASTGLDALNLGSDEEEDIFFTEDEFDNDEDYYYDEEDSESSSSDYSVPDISQRPSRRSIIQKKTEEQEARTRQMQHSSSSAPSTSQDTTENALLALVWPNNGLWKGSSLASVAIVEFGDYECPYCRNFHQETLPKLQKNYIETGKVRYTFRNYPMSFHVHAMEAAKFVECARDQSDKFAWEIHDNIFANSSGGNPPTSRMIAKILRSIHELDADAVIRCATSDMKLGLIGQDMQDAEAAGLLGVPAFWIIGPDNSVEMISGAQSYETFTEVLDRMLRK